MTTSCYYTLGGTDSHLVMAGADIGILTDVLYHLMPYWGNQIAEDGLVAQYCSQATDGMLATKSQFYEGNDKATAMFKLNHIKLVGLGEGRDNKFECLSPERNPEYGKLLGQLGTWIDGWIKNPSPPCERSARSGAEAPAGSPSRGREGT